MNPTNTAPGRRAFIVRWRRPLCVRWHSSTNTNSSPTAGLGCALSSSRNASKSATPFLPNLWTSEQRRRGAGWPSRAIRSAPLRTRTIGSPPSRKTPSICLSSSSRSVTTRTRALGRFSRIHRASITITMLFPLPWVCQMIPLRWPRTCPWAAFTAAYWCARGSFLTPPSNSTKSRISSRSRPFPQSFSRYLSSL